MSSIIDDDDPLFTPRAPASPSEATTASEPPLSSPVPPAPPRPPGPDYGSTRTPTPSRPVAAPGQVELLRWGLVGSETYCDPSQGTTSGRKVVRTIAGQYAFHAPPKGLGLPAWSPSRKAAQVYEMSLAAGMDPKKVFNLDDLGRTIRERADANELSSGDRELEELDNAVIELLKAVEALHESGRGAGPLHTGAVLIVPGTGGRRIILPDLGFTWEGPDPDDDPLSPPWLQRANNPLARLWSPDSPSRLQKAAVRPKVGPDGKVDPTIDVRTLARLFADLLDPDSLTPEGIRPRVTRPALVWGVLQEADRGGHTVASLRVALSRDNTPLSHNFTGPRVDPGPGTVNRPPPVWPIVAGLGAVGALVAILLIVTWRPKEEIPCTGGKNQPDPPVTVEDDAWKALVAKFRRETDPVKRPAALDPLADYVVKHSGEALRREYLGLWKETFASPPRLRADQLVEESSFYRALRVQLEKVHTGQSLGESPIPREEQSCLDQLPLY